MSVSEKCADGFYRSEFVTPASDVERPHPWTTHFWQPDLAISEHGSLIKIFLRTRKIIDFHKSYVVRHSVREKPAPALRATRLQHIASCAAYLVEDSTPILDPVALIGISSSVFKRTLLPRNLALCLKRIPAALLLIISFRSAINGRAHIRPGRQT